MTLKLSSAITTETGDLSMVKIELKICHRQRKKIYYASKHGPSDLEGRAPSHSALSDVEAL